MAEAEAAGAEVPGKIYVRFILNDVIFAPKQSGRFITVRDIALYILPNYSWEEISATMRKISAPPTETSKIRCDAIKTVS